MTEPLFLPEYQQAVEGVSRGADPVLVDQAHALLWNAHEMIRQAERRIFSFALRKGPPESAYSYVKRKMHVRNDAVDEEGYALFLVLHLALASAKTDTRYWGIEDPKEESYCGYCKKALPAPMFNESQHTCDDCCLKRRST